MSKRGKLPLVSPNWWPLGKAVPYIRVQVGHRDIADWDFLAAVNEGPLRAKIEQRNWRTKPPSQKTVLLTPELRRRHELTAHINNAWILRPRTAAIAPITPPYALFFWRPDLEKIWPPPRSPNERAIERRRPGPKTKDDWPLLIAAKLIHMARHDPEALENVDALIEPMKKFLRNEIGWAPQDPKQVREKIVLLLRFVRR